MSALICTSGREMDRYSSPAIGAVLTLSSALFDPLLTFPDSAVPGRPLPSQRAVTRIRASPVPGHNYEMM